MAKRKSNHSLMALDKGGKAGARKASHDSNVALATVAPVPPSPAIPFKQPRKADNTRKGKKLIYLWLHPEELVLLKGIGKFKHLPRDNIATIIMWDVLGRGDFVE